jgi:hypothetical protein
VNARYVLVLLLLVAPSAAAYTQNRDLESALARSDPGVLAQLPAKGYKDGAAGFFRAYELYIVPHSARAWCQEQERGPLGPGCYVEFYFQMRGRTSESNGRRPCALLGRWRKAPDAAAYAPTPGAYYSSAMAVGNWEAVVLAFDQTPRTLKFGPMRSTDDCVS